MLDVWREACGRSAQVCRAAGDAKVTLALPNDTNLKCVKFANQWIVIDNGGALFGVVALSNGGEGEIGG